MDARFRERLNRSVVKTITYRICGSAITFLVVFVLTGKRELGLGAGILDFFAKLVLFFTHERLWNLVTWGHEEVPSGVIWFTGLSGAGKTTLAQGFAEKLRLAGFPVEMLDGDDVRGIFKDVGFSREERIRYLRTMGFVASRLEKSGSLVVAAFITPYEEARTIIRSQIKNFVEVYVDTPLEVCEARDVKKLYERARSNQIGNFTGVSDVFEQPTRPDIVLKTQGRSVEETLGELMGKVRSGFPVFERAL